MVVREHRPEPTECPGRNLHTELRQIAFDERSDEVLPPLQAHRVGPGEVRAGKAAPQPQPAQMDDSSFGEREAIQVMKGDATRQGL
jgi:hypothetical protein